MRKLLASKWFLAISCFVLLLTTCSFANHVVGSFLPSPLDIQVTLS